MNARRRQTNQRFRLPRTLQPVHHCCANFLAEFVLLFIDQSHFIDQKPPGFGTHAKLAPDLDGKLKKRGPLFLRLHIRRMRAGIGNLRGSLVNLRFVGGRPVDENCGEFPIRC